MADYVIGKRNFKDRDYENNDPVWPYSVKVNHNGVLAITDTQYYRVLLWSDWRKAFHEKTDVIIGQKTLDANGQNQFNWFPAANTLNWCYDTYFYRNGIWMADTGNSHLLWFAKVPTGCNMEADNLIGQDDFKT